MATKIVNVDIDMYGNRVTNLCVEVLPELPETTSEGRLVYLKAARQIFVYSDGLWQTVGELNPKKLSAFENDMGYLTADTAGLDNYYTKEETDDKLEKLTRLQFKVVDALPDTGESNIIYLVPSTSSKAKNVKDEWIWVDGDWELIGSTAFKLDVIQNADGITINDKILQKADESHDGLMTKEMVTEFRGKQDKLTAGPNISIENGVISAIGGGSGGGHASFVGSFGGDGQLEYTVRHMLGTYNIIFQMRTAPPVRFVQAAVYADDKDSIRVVFSEPMNDVVHISILACDVSSPETEDTPVVTLFTEASETWTYTNDSGKPVYVQTYDETGNEIRADVTESSEDEYASVVANFIGEYTGSMVSSKASIAIPFADTSGEVTIDVTEYDGFAAGDWFLVQVYIDRSGALMPDIVQNAGTGIVTVDLGDNPISGTIALFKATQVHPIDNETEKIIEHGLGRIVGVQVYLDESGQTMPDVVCTDENTVVISANPAITGHALIL